ncbi:MAG: TonB-dependent receptor [Halioglobus sp.]|nr:TonB-dependent receptor [Halioglobus sp.]
MSLRNISPIHPMVLAVSALVATMAAPSQAQTPAPSGTVLEEVVVTAEKRTESLQEVPIAITAFSQKDIEQRGISNVADLLGQIPSVGGFTAPGSRGSTSLSIRGVAGGSPSNLSLDPAVGIYMDGVYLGKMTGVSVDVAELERIEVLRGPQGTLYGRNSTGGAVNYITRKPSGEFGVRAVGSVGNHDYYGAQLNVDTPSIGQVGVGAGRLAANFGVQTRDRDGFYTNTTNGDDFNDLDRQAWRVGLAWDITENLRADYAYDGSQLDEVNNLDAVVGINPLGATSANRIGALQGTLAQAQAWAATPGTDPRIGQRWVPSLQKTISVYEDSVAAGEGRRNRGGIDVTPRSKVDSEGHGLTLAWDKDEITFKSITGYRTSKTKARGDIDSIDSRNDANGVAAWNDLAHLTLGSIYGVTGGNNATFLPIDAFWNQIDAEGGALHFSQDSVSDYDQFSQELQVIGSTDQIEYVGGLYYFEDTAKYRRSSTALVPLAPYGETRYKMTTEAWAAYGQATWTPGWLDDRLSFTGGLRYTEEDKDINWNNGEMTGALTAPTPAMSASNDKSFDNVSGSFTVAYQATDEINTYFRYGNGYRSGGFNGEAFDSAPFEEETIDQYEIGVKSELWDSRLRVNAALYTYTYDDLQVSLIETVDGTPTTNISNAGKAERWGGELEIQVAPIDDLIVGLSYAYIHGDFDEFPDVCGTLDPSDCLIGKDFAKRGGSPDNQFNLYADYVFARTAWGEVTGYLNLNWQDQWYASAAYPALVTVSRGGPTVPILYENRELDSRTLVDARLSLENVEVGGGTMRFTLWGKNLTDESYPTYGINFGNDIGLITQNYGDPRTYGIEVAYEY